MISRASSTFSLASAPALDRAWFGLAFLTVGLVSLAYSGWGLVFAILGVAVGAALLGWAIALAVTGRRQGGSRTDGQP
jgi:hypothetical protein